MLFIHTNNFSNTFCKLLTFYRNIADLLDEIRLCQQFDFTEYMTAQASDLCAPTMGSSLSLPTSALPPPLYDKELSTLLQERMRIFVGQQASELCKLRYLGGTGAAPPLGSGAPRTSASNMALVPGPAPPTRASGGLLVKLGLKSKK